MRKVKRLPPRARARQSDTWDLSSLYPSDAAWASAFNAYQRRLRGYAKHRGRLARSAADLAACLRFDSRTDRLAERLGAYAYLRAAEDQADSQRQAMVARFQNVATRAAAEASFIRPEILAIAAGTMRRFLAARQMKPFRLAVERLLRFRPHTLGKPEESLLAMQGEMAQTASRAFRQLHDADLKFGFVTNEKGERVQLGNATLMSLLMSSSRSVRRKAFHQYYEQFSAHQNTFAATLSGSIHNDVYYARARGYSSSLAAALFPDSVPQRVYDGLIEAVRRRLPALHGYYQLRRRKMRLKEIRHYDTYTPILSDLETKRPWAEAVKLVIAALKPLGDQYCSVLEQGLRGRWCDRYPNQGKQSGAFSCGTYDGDPYILMNYKPEVLDDVFTLAHEAGHSMHSLLSAQHQPFPYYDYTIFVAEVASTFNEQLLTAHLLDHARDDKERAYLINRELDGMRGTIYRQTMFAEFEKVTHEMAEAGEPLTIDALRSAYRRLLEAYFGPDFVLDEQLSLECLRIPHFYRAFYVYKYATGMSAAIALSQRVLRGGRGELDDYLRFLKGGCSQEPLDLLRDAGVDMEKPEAVESALEHFERRVEELGQLL